MLDHGDDHVLGHELGHRQRLEDWIGFGDEDFLVDWVWLGDGDVLRDMLHNDLDWFGVFHVTILLTISSVISTASVSTGRGRLPHDEGTQNHDNCWYVHDLAGEDNGIETELRQTDWLVVVVCRRRCCCCCCRLLVGRLSCCVCMCGCRRSWCQEFGKTFTNVK